MEGLMSTDLQHANQATETATRARLLVVDDDLKFCRLISDYLSRYGYDVTLVHDGLAALQIALSSTWDAIVLDVMLPGLEGYGVLKRLREETQVPILMLTAMGDETDRIVGLELGADDYLPKTFSPRELVARLRAVLRRTNRPVPVTGGTDTEMTVGSISINTGSRTVTNDGELLILTPVEFDLLVVLANARGRIKTREQLLNEIRDRHFDIYDRSIDVHISALRRKLKDDPKNPKYIRTIRSAGYMLINPLEGTS
jgi:DNA-binding response OmpR family regulator